MNSFGAVISVTGPGVGFPGKWTRTADSIIAARPVLPTAANPVSFGTGVVRVGTVTGGYFQSLSDYLATATNAQFLLANFAGIAVWNFKTQIAYSSLTQGQAATVSTTATQASVPATTIVVASATGIIVGQSVEGFGIQPNTLVTVVSGTTITLSLPTTAAIPALTPVTFTTPSNVPVVGNYPQGQICEVLERSSIAVQITTGTPQDGAPVYVRTVANANLPGTFVGDFEAAQDLATNSLTYGCTIGSATITTSAGTGLAPGQYVTGPGIPANTFIVSGATTSWVLSNPATATIASLAVLVAYNTAPLGTTEPWLKFRTGLLDSNGVAEVTLLNRHVA